MRIHTWTRRSAAVILLSITATLAASAQPAARWSFDDAEGGTVVDAAGPHQGRVHGARRTASGAEGRSMVFDGHTTCASVPSHEALSIGEGPFTFAAWACAYAPGRGQQMIAAKNDYAANKREWGLMVDHDARFRLWVRGNGWVTVGGTTVVEPGRWHHVAVTVENGQGRIYVDGREEGVGPLPAAVGATDAQFSFGGVRSGGKLMQLLVGALDEAVLVRAALPPEAIRKLADRNPEPHPVVNFKPVQLWSGEALPKSAEIAVLPNVDLHLIKAHEPAVDGYQWLHGVGLIWHRGRLYASFGHNKGTENTRGEQARGRVSDDGGKTWGDVFTIASTEGSLGVSHGVFASREDGLWSFNGAFYDDFQRTHMRAYKLDETGGAWTPVEVAIGDGFWPLQNPVKMDDGNWIMAGARIAKGYDAMVGHLPAVAISRGDDFTAWDLVVIECHDSVPPTSVWGESTVIVDGPRVTNIARWGGSNPTALISESADFGRTWTPVRASNLPMAASKPHAGILSTGQRYLVCTTTSDSGNRRSPLTIAVSRPGQTTLSHVFVIRHANQDGAPDSNERSALSYPCAVEHEGKLYVGYSNSGGRGGNFNSAELAVIPVADFAVPEPAVLWTGDEIPNGADVSVAEGVEIHVIRPPEAGLWMKGVHVAWHNDKLYAQFGYNDKLKEQGENSPGEQARYCVSDDGGKTWSEDRIIAAGEGNGGISHGVFLSHGGRLWSFNGAFVDKISKVHTRAFVMDEDTGAWEAKGTIIHGGFWPLQEPIKMDDGNWIMAGARIGDGHPAAVAISRGDDLLAWDLVVIPGAPGRMWGESSVLVDGKRIVNIARYGSRAVALVAESEDYGRTWTPSRPSNLPMATSRPFTGTLANGQNYLVCSTSADGGNTRWPLTRAVSRPGETTFSRVVSLNSSRGSFIYPGAAERDGVLYVGYTRGHSPEIAVVPLASLAVRDPVALWTGGEVPATADAPVLKGVEFSVIKPFRFAEDGYRFHHGVALAWHKGRFYATYGINRYGENMGGEEAVFHVSPDGGRTWGPMQVIESGSKEPPVGVSHGVLLSRGGELWAFHGAFGKHITDGLHTRAYRLNEATGEWESKGRMLDGFWPLQEPLKMGDGNWIMAGARPGGGNPAAVAISRGDDLTAWDRVVIPKAPGEMWGESSVILFGHRVLNIARYSSKSQTVALAAVSEDYGRTWTASAPGNLPMAASKPYTGTLSTGQHYLICSTTADGGNRRSPLTIALTRPGEETFSKIFVIRHALFPEGPGESHERASLAYPYAIEHEGKLYVGYSNSGGGIGRTGEGRELWNNNSIEMAIIPVESLRIE